MKGLILKLKSASGRHNPKYREDLELLPRKLSNLPNFKPRNVRLRIREAGEENSDEEQQRNGKQGNENEVAQMEEVAQANEEEENARLRQMVHLSNSSPLLAHQELSTSQSEFFRMLDEKINNGPDYEGTNEFEFTLDHAQLCRMLQEWQSAKHKSRYGHQHQLGHQQPKLQKFHSVQSNGEPPGMKARLAHQASLYSAAPPTARLPCYPSQPYGDPYGLRHYQPPPQHVYQPPPPQHYPHQMPPSSYQQPAQNFYPPAPAPQAPMYPPPPSGPPQTYHHHHHHMGASSVVLYDKRGGYYTELA